MTNPHPLHVNELMAELTGRTVEAFSLWADANQKVLRELVDLSAGTAREGARLYAEIQSSALEAVKEGQAYLLRRQDAMQDAPRSPPSTPVRRSKPRSRSSPARCSRSTPRSPE